MELLVAAREKAGLTQVQLAKRLGRPQSFVSKYETGERSLNLNEFIRIAVELNLEVGRTVREIAASYKAK